MKQSDHHNSTQFSSLLLLRRQKVLADIREKLHSADDPNKFALINHLEEVGDWVEADVLNDTDIALLNNELIELRDLDSALLRIKAGTYGICADCSEPISPERISAQPTAQRCVACQTKADKRHGVGRHASL